MTTTSKETVCFTVDLPLSLHCSSQFLPSVEESASAELFQLMLEKLLLGATLQPALLQETEQVFC
jgi:hypothetical protein